MRTALGVRYRLAERSKWKTQLSVMLTHCHALKHFPEPLRIITQER
jgi:hypothetical protein